MGIDLLFFASLPFIFPPEEDPDGEKKSRRVDWKYILFRLLRVLYFIIPTSPSEAESDEYLYMWVALWCEGMKF